MTIDALNRFMKKSRRKQAQGAMAGTALDGAGSNPMAALETARVLQRLVDRWSAADWDAQRTAGDQGA